MLSIDEKKAIIDYRKQKAYDNLYDATEDEVLPYIERTLVFITDMENLITLKEK